MIDMIERTTERDRAVALLEGSMVMITAQGREPDIWERSCLGHGIGAAFRGAYSLAITDAGLALTPVCERSVKWRALGEVESWTVDLLRKALDEVRHEPARAFPHFGLFASTSR